MSVAPRTAPGGPGEPMIGTHAIAEQAPLDYRYALDAAMPVLAGRGAPMVRCDAPELWSEVGQRIPLLSTVSPANGALWVEPLAGRWQADLAMLARALSVGAPLVVVASRPLARLLPERGGWGGGSRSALGLRPGGVAQLCRALPTTGLELRASFGVHTVAAIALNLLGRRAERWERPDLADRLGFEARLRYCASGPLAALSTVALLIAWKEQG